MRSIPLTRARHAITFARALKARGLAVDRLWEKSRLPPGLLETEGGDDVISAISMLDFAERAAFYNGFTDLGYWAGRLPVSDFGDFGLRVSRSPTLAAAIGNFCRNVRNECSEADYFPVVQRSNAWFCHGPIGNTTLLHQQHELYALMIMVQVIQLALGVHWKPRRIRLQHRDGRSLVDNEFLSSADIEFGSSLTGVEFPLDALAKPIRITQKDENLAGVVRNDAGSAALPVHALDSLKALIESQLWQGQRLSVASVAEMSGVSLRTLQRFLKKGATSYSDLLDEVRYRMALPLIEDRAISIADIASQLGYADVSHFSRAFKRLSGVSPRYYRNRLSG